MARKRMIDPKFWSDDKIIELEPLSRLCFIGLWNFSDDTGVHKYNAKMIKAEIFPADEMPIKQIDMILTDLINCGLIEVSDDNSLIRMKNWNMYQTINRPQPSNHKFIASTVNTHGTRTPNRIEENIKEVNKSKDNGQTDELFDQFYNLYPRKVQKERAKKAFKKLSNTTKKLAIEGLNKYIAYWQKQNVDKEFVPHPATWLNGKSWEDELADEKKIEKPLSPQQEKNRKIILAMHAEEEKRQERLKSQADAETVEIGSIGDIFKLKTMEREKYYEKSENDKS